jgi:hypothetical protein
MIRVQTVVLSGACFRALIRGHEQGFLPLPGTAMGIIRFNEDF